MLSGHLAESTPLTLKKGGEEPCTIERLARFMVDLLGYCEITLKSHTEPAIIAFRNRVAEKYKAEVAQTGHSDTRQAIELAHRERSHTDMWNHQNSQMPL